MTVRRCPLTKKDLIVLPRLMWCLSRLPLLRGLFLQLLAQPLLLLLLRQCLRRRVVLLWSAVLLLPLRTFTRPGTRSRTGQERAMRMQVLIQVRPLLLARPLAVQSRLLRIEAKRPSSSSCSPSPTTSSWSGQEAFPQIPPEQQAAHSEAVKEAAVVRRSLLRGRQTV